MSSPVRFFNESSLAFPLKPKPAGDLFLKVMHALGKTEIKVNVIAKSDEALRDMKREYFGKDVYTDVISFLIEASPVLEGEIYCSPERIKKNAENYSEFEAREFARILVHGAAHLCGYRDYSKEEAREMKALEEKFLMQFYDN